MTVTVVPIDGKFYLIGSRIGSRIELGWDGIRMSTFPKRPCSNTFIAFFVSSYRVDTTGST